MFEKRIVNLIITSTLVILLILGFIFRIYGLKTNYSFWIDEFSTGQSAAAIAKSGSLQTTIGYFEPRNLLSYYLTSLSMRVLGINEFAARFPSVIWGTLMILVGFLVFQRLFNRRIGLAVAILTTFSMIEITWSRQARSYALFQLVYLMTVYFLWQLFEKIRKEKVTLRDFILPIFFLIISLLAHLLAVTIILSGIIYAVFFTRQELIKFSKYLMSKQKIILGLILVAAIWLFWQSGLGIIFREVFISHRFPLKISNNFWYYHSFLWRQYSLISFLAFLGILLALSAKERKHFFLIIILVVHLVVAIFFLPWLDTRYLYAVFPIFFFFYSLYFLDRLSRWWWRESPRLQVIFFFFLAFFLVVNGHKFTLKPRLFSSPNADMREIPLVDYNIAYEIMKNKSAGAGQPLVVIDTWGDRLAWYLGRDYPYAFWIRQSQRLGYRIEQGKPIENTLNLKTVTDKESLLQVIKAYPQGFVFIDGHEVPFLPQDALSYIENNLKREKEFSRFSLDPDPYDTWPAWLYSWGFDS